MDGISFRKALTSLNMPLYKAAEFLGVSDATVRNWANDRARIPQPVAMLLRFMVAMDFTPDYVNRQINRR